MASEFHSPWQQSALAACGLPVAKWSANWIENDPIALPGPAWWLSRRERAAHLTGVENADFNGFDPCGRGLAAAEPDCTQLAAGRSAPGAAFDARPAGVSGGLPGAPVVKAAVAAADGDAAKPSAAQTEQSLQEINKVLASLSISVQFQVDPNYKDVIIKVVDQQTDKVILQIPTMEVVRISKAMDSLKGLLFSQAV